MKKLGRSLSFVAIFPLVACGADTRAADLHDCRITVRMPNDHLTEEQRDEFGEEVADCMKAIGYRHDTADSRCLDDVDLNPYCYVCR